MALIEQCFAISRRLLIYIQIATNWLKLETIGDANRPVGFDFFQRPPVAAIKINHWDFFGEQRDSALRNDPRLGALWEPSASRRLSVTTFQAVCYHFSKKW